MHDRSDCDVSDLYLFIFARLHLNRSHPFTLFHNEFIFLTSEYLSSMLLFLLLAPLLRVTESVVNIPRIRR